MTNFSVISYFFAHHLQKATKNYIFVIRITQIV